MKLNKIIKSSKIVESNQIFQKEKQFEKIIENEHWAEKKEKMNKIFLISKISNQVKEILENSLFFHSSYRKNG